MTTTTFDLLDIFSSNKESEEDGRWFFVDPDETVGFRIRAFGSKAVLDLREKLMKPFAAMTRAGAKIPDEKNEEIGLKVIAGAVLADWKGIVLAGETIPYTPENALTVLSDERISKLATFILSHSMDGQNYRDETREDGAGNS